MTRTRPEICGEEDAGTYEGEGMVEPQKDECQGRELEDNLPRIELLFIAENVNLMFILVMAEHDSEGREVGHDGSSDIDQSALAQEGPW